MLCNHYLLIHSFYLTTFEREVQGGEYEIKKREYEIKKRSRKSIRMNGIFSQGMYLLFCVIHTCLFIKEVHL